MRKDFQHSRRKEEIRYPFFALYLVGLRRLYCTEVQIMMSLPKFIAAADSKELVDALSNRSEQTVLQIERLEEVFEILRRGTESERCKPMSALLEDSLEQAEHFVTGPVRDTALVVGVRAANNFADLHYRISQLAAEHLGEEVTVKLLGETISANARFEDELNKLGKSAVLLRAVDVFLEPLPESETALSEPVDPPPDASGEGGLQAGGGPPAIT